MKHVLIKPATAILGVLIFTSLICLSFFIFHEEPAAVPVQVNNDLRFRGEAKTPPWSGWWWPFHISLPNHLYDPRGPMDKYDSLSVAQGLSNPGTRAWERENHFANQPGQEWYGHCNGWAAASILEPEPRKTQTIDRISFNPQDIKGLLSEWHWWDPAISYYGTRYDGPANNINDINPQEFHQAIINFIGKKGLPIIMDISGGTQEINNPQIWNYPAYQYQMEYSPEVNNPERIHVRCQIWLASSTQPDYLGTAPMLKTYYYWISKDTLQPTAGGWEKSNAGSWDTFGDSQKDHPDFLWYPAPAAQHQLLQRKQIDQIVSGGGSR